MTERATPNYSDAERELRRVEEKHPIPISKRDVAIESRLLDTSTIARFWSKVERGTGCWEWKAGTFRDGYGCFAIPVQNKHRSCNVKASRFSWALANGMVPVGLVVRHTCDNPRCVNPAHLLHGTQRDNVSDAVSKGRQSRGSGRPLSIFTDDDVRAIRSLATERSYRDIARDYGCSVTAIRDICLRRRWQHVV